ncbi:VOC family protein [Flexivirga sp. ID2601S]|uniref:VOC family protein n=1 Tax=Flexivirga aerilata TaxID=1656889 RepID=A0A849AI80_9MICO|nr:VOC family protein [Flexivirga aerilata]NNG39557.1 VOC family protein [Flexivirga aerilata]
MALIELQLFALDSPEPERLGRFYADLLGWEVTRADDDWWEVTPPGGGVPLAIQWAREFTPPTWPDPAVPMQAHLDFTVDSYDEAEAHALSLGARKVEGDEEHPGFRVYLDPSGHPFCLCLRG